MRDGSTKNGSRNSIRRNGRKTLSTYVDLMKTAGPPGASSNGFNENLALFSSGKCAIWIDATVAASMVTQPEEVRRWPTRSASRLLRDTGLGKNANWLWAWRSRDPRRLEEGRAAEKFIAWATSKDYDQARRLEGEAGPACRQEREPRSTRIPNYLKVAPFAKPTLASIDAADPNKADGQAGALYVGVQYAAIPEFQGIGTSVGQQFSAALASSSTVDAGTRRGASHLNRTAK